jgi:hypothetical protein
LGLFEIMPEDDKINKYPEAHRQHQLDPFYWTPPNGRINRAALFANRPGPTNSPPRLFRETGADRLSRLGDLGFHGSYRTSYPYAVFGKIRRRCLGDPQLSDRPLQPTRPAHR